MGFHFGICDPHNRKDKPENQPKSHESIISQ
jgi:hypothetical protein